MSVKAITKDGRTRYQVRWWQDGRHPQRTFDLRRDAVAFERERRREAALGAYGVAEPSSMTTGDWLREWFAEGRAFWAPSTIRTQVSVLDRWIDPYVGGVRLRDLGHARVRTWRAEIIADGCSPHQANKAARVLSAALGVAVQAGKLPFNPVAGLRSIPTAITRVRALTPEEVERIRAAMPTARDAVLVGLLAYAGLRPGEALALRWSDLGEHLLVIDRAVSDGEIRQTKTNTRRTVDIVPPLARDLADLRPKVADPDALVIHGERGQVLDLNNWRPRTWGAACEAAGVAATPYDGRHTFASLLIHEGRSLPYVTAAMGHASISTTLRHYAHVFDAARLATGAPMVETIEAARADLEARGVRPTYAGTSVSVLYAPGTRAKTA